MENLGCDTLKRSEATDGKEAGTGRGCARTHIRSYGLAFLLKSLFCCRDHRHIANAGDELSASRTNERRISTSSTTTCASATGTITSKAENCLGSARGLRRAGRVLSPFGAFLLAPRMIVITIGHHSCWRNRVGLRNTINKGEQRRSGKTGGEINQGVGSSGLSREFRWPGSSSDLPPRLPAHKVEIPLMGLQIEASIHTRKEHKGRWKRNKDKA